MSPAACSVTIKRHGTILRVLVSTVLVNDWIRQSLSWQIAAPKKYKMGRAASLFFLSGIALSMCPVLAQADENDFIKRKEKCVKVSKP